MKAVSSNLKSRPMLVLEALLGVSRKHNKKYCWVSQARIAKLVGEFGGVWMSNRTLNRDLKLLEDGGWIERIRRLRKDSRGKLLFTCTLYKFKAKVFSALFSLGNGVKRIFSSFRLPKWAEYQLQQKRAFSEANAPPVDKLLIKVRDGSILHWDRTNGRLSYPSGVPY